MVDEPVVAAHDIAAHVAALEITTTDVKPDGDLDCDSDSCREHATVTHELAGYGEWTYDTLIKAELNQGQWLIQWSPATFHPDLTEVTTLVRHRTLAPRAPILDRNGIALTPERAIVRVGVVPSKVRPATHEAVGRAAQHRHRRTARPRHRRPTRLVRLGDRPAQGRLPAVPRLAAQDPRDSSTPHAEPRPTASWDAPCSARSGRRRRTR
jgi:hypothetical protein